MSPSEGIVVSDDGSPDAHFALTWATALSERLSRPLSVMYAGQDGATSADLLVIGSGSHGTRNDRLDPVIGPVNAHARCPVIVVPPAPCAVPGPGHPVVVGVDCTGCGDPACGDSACCDAALDFAARTALSTGADLHLVSAYPSPMDDRRSLASVPELEESGEPNFDTIAHHSLSTSIHRAEARVARMNANGELRTVVCEGDPAEVLLTASKDAGMLVIGTHHVSTVPLRQVPVGDGVLAHPVCPVAIVAPPSRPHPSGDA